MSGDDSDKESKTEEATEKRKHDAVEKGNVPISREVSVFASMAATLAYGSFLAEGGFRRLTHDLTGMLDNTGARTFETGADVLNTLLPAFGLMALFLGPLVALVMGAGIAASVLQNMPRLVVSRIEPKLERLSPLSGWNRLFGASGLMEFFKAFLKIVFVSVLAISLLHSERERVLSAMFNDPFTLPELALTISIRLLSIICVATIVLVAGDLVWARLTWRRNLRMSRQDMKDEYKHSEGDPLVKSRMRSIARDRARTRMMDAVPRATVVLVNPTHYAIAMRYVREEGGAPVVLAKGQDLLALKIRSIAESHEIPIVENRDLVRAMYGSVEVDQMIPPEFYKTIAELLYVLYYAKEH